MCDYSLHGIASRPAKIGDKLISANFPHSVTRGFAAVDEPTVAVCLLPGTELAFERDVEPDQAFGPFLRRFGLAKAYPRVARFRQIDMQRPQTHHDALEFANGKILLVTRLCVGQRAAVLQLPATARGVRMSDEHKQVLEEAGTPSD